MSDGTKSFAELFAALENFGVNCPTCGAPLFRPKVLSRQTGKKMAGACMRCGYKQPPTEKRSKSAKTTPQLQRDARKNRTIGYYLNYSVFANESIMAKDFGNFRRDTDGQKELLNFGESIVQQIVNKPDPVHALIVGTPGVGKSHIANGMLVAIQKGSDYQMTTMFVDWHRLMKLRKQGFSDDAKDVKAKIDGVMDQMAKADVVVIDDIGADRGTDFDKDLAGEVYRLREDKTVITTTNLKGSDLRAYMDDERTMSRMSAHSQGATFAVRGIADQRGA